MQTSDDGFVVASVTRDSTLTDFHGADDILLTKFDPKGAIEWQRCYGGSNSDELLGSQGMLELSNGDLVLIGTSKSNDGDVMGLKDTGAFIRGDAWIFSVTKLGVMKWQRMLGGTGSDAGTAVVKASDSTILVGGTSQSADGDFSGIHGPATNGNYNFDAFLAKLTSTGDLVWTKLYGGSRLENLTSLVAMDSSRFACSGLTTSDDGDFPGRQGGPGNSDPDAFVMTVDALGAIRWARTIGGSRRELPNYLATIPGTQELMFAISTNSVDGDCSSFARTYEYNLFRLDNSGGIMWSKAYGGSKNEGISTIIPGAGGSFWLGGISFSGDGDVPKHYGTQQDAWLINVSDTGALLKSYVVGGTTRDILTAAITTRDNKIAFIGGSESFDYDLSALPAFGDLDAWVVKCDVNSLGLKPEIRSALDVAIFPNPCTSSFRIQLDPPGEKDCRYTLRNVIGQTINSGAVKNGMVDVDVHTIPAGMYLVTVSGSTLSRTVVLVRE